MFLERILPVRQLSDNVANRSARPSLRLNNFPMEEFPAGAFAVVFTTLGGMIGGQLGAWASAFLHLSSPNLLSASVVLGIALSFVVALKLVFWLNDRTHHDAR